MPSVVKWYVCYPDVHNYASPAAQNRAATQPAGSSPSIAKEGWGHAQTTVILSSPTAADRSNTCMCVCVCACVQERLHRQNVVCAVFTSQGKLVALWAECLINKAQLPSAAPMSVMLRRMKINKWIISGNHKVTLNEPQRALKQHIALVN